MSYLGSSAAPIPVAFAGQQGQAYNGGTNTFTLSRAVARTLDIDLIVNNVVQSPYDGSYTVSGNVVTTAETVSAGVGNVYVIFRDAPVGSFAPIDGSVTPAKLDRSYVPTAGGTMTGPLIAPGLRAAGTPALGFQASSWFIQQEDSIIARSYVCGPDASTYGQWSAYIAKSTGSPLEMIRLGQDGRVFVPQGQLAFPATQNPSSDANTLDDYEEGTWTPVATRVTTAPSVSYGRQVGTYIKIGRMVYANFEIQLTAIATNGAGYNAISGLPFPISSANAAWFDIGGGMKYNTAFSISDTVKLSGGGGQGANAVCFLPAGRSTSEVNENWQPGYVTATIVYQTTA
ncbi:hypothetical protein [Polynucleobacter sp. UK-Kesae-W10]|uniref:hypothetical protein n=1 Tax=Polynucleobacter sp. UK-Kesae-W10 TaxID=1819738 RepID=UPI001C0B2D52|nr:hypothetical protein [Polynucleobacter sp. UK-Kesae-W10]MBU3577585.1 hypothetical protein [Polynucleobacter sp. UK-Kesae-W10]